MSGRSAGGASRGSGRVGQRASESYGRGRGETRPNRSSSTSAAPPLHRLAGEVDARYRRPSRRGPLVLMKLANMLSGRLAALRIGGLVLQIEGAFKGGGLAGQDALLDRCHDQ